MTPIAGPSLWTLLVLLFLATLIDFVCPLTSSLNSTTSSITTLSSLSIIPTTTKSSKVLNFNASTPLQPPPSSAANTSTSSTVHTFSITYSSPNKGNQTEGEDDDLAEAESSYALEEDDEEDNNGFDGTTFDEDTNEGGSSRVPFDHLNDLLTRSALSPEVSPSTADHYQVLGNRSSSLKDFYDALTAQDNGSDGGAEMDGLDSDSGDGGKGSDGTVEDDTETGDGQTIRLPSITTVVNGKGGLENRQDFLLSGSSSSLPIAASASAPSPSSYQYHRAQQLALYNQLSQMVQNSIANARAGGQRAKGNSYVATGKKSPSTATAAASGKSKKLQIVYIKVPLLNLLEKGGPRAGDYSGIEGVSGDTDYDGASGGGGSGGLVDSSDDDIPQTSNLASNHDANALSAIAQQLAGSQPPISSTTAQLFQSLMNLNKANYLQQNGTSNEGLSDQQLQDLYTPWTPVNSGSGQQSSKVVGWSSGNTLGPSQTQASPDSYGSSASSPKPTYIGQQSRHHRQHHQVSSSFQGSKSTKEDPDTSSSSSYSSYSRYPMQSTTKTSTSTTTTTTTTPSPFYSKYKYNSPSSSSSFSSKFPSSSFLSNSSSPSKYSWNSYWNSTSSKSSPFKSWSSSYSRSNSVPSTAESAPPSSRTATTSSSEEYSGVTSKPSGYSGHSNVPPHNHVYQPAVHGQYNSGGNSYFNDEEGGNYSSTTGKKGRHLGLGILPIVIQIDTKALREEQEQEALRSGRGGSGNGDQQQSIHGTGGLNLRSILQQLDNSADSVLPPKGGRIHYQQPQHHNGKHFNSNRGPQNYHSSASSWSSSSNNLEHGQQQQSGGGNFNAGGSAYGYNNNKNHENNNQVTATITIEKPYQGPVSNADQIDDSQWPGKVEFISSPFAKNNHNNHHPQNNFRQQNSQHHNHHRHQNKANFNNPGPNHQFNNNHHNNHQNFNHQQHISWNDNQHFQHQHHHPRHPFNQPDFMTSASSSSGSSPPRRPKCQRQQPKKKPPCSRKNKQSQFRHSSANMLPSASNVDFDDSVLFSRLPGFAGNDGTSSSSSSSSNSNFFSRRPLGGALSLRQLAKSRRQKSALQKSLLQSALLTESGGGVFPGSGSWTTMPLPEGSSQALANFYSELLGTSVNFDTSAASGNNPLAFQQFSNNFPLPVPYGGQPMDTSASVNSPVVFNQPPVMLSPPPPPPPPAVIAAQLAVAAAASGQLPPLQVPTTSSNSQVQVSLPLLKKDPSALNFDQTKEVPSNAPQKSGTSSGGVSSRFRFWSPFAAAISRTDKLAKQLTTPFKGIKSKGGVLKSTSSSSSSASAPVSVSAVAAPSSPSSFLAESSVQTAT